MSTCYIKELFLLQAKKRSIIRYWNVWFLSVNLLLLKWDINLKYSNHNQFGRTTKNRLWVEYLNLIHIYVEQVEFMFDLLLLTLYFMFMYNCRLLSLCFICYLDNTIKWQVQQSRWLFHQYFWMHFLYLNMIPSTSCQTKDLLWNIWLFSSLDQ